MAVQHLYLSPGTWILKHSETMTYHCNCSYRTVWSDWSILCAVPIIFWASKHNNLRSSAATCVDPMRHGTMPCTKKDVGRTGFWATGEEITAHHGPIVSGVREVVSSDLTKWALGWFFSTGSPLFTMVSRSLTSDYKNEPPNWFLGLKASTFAGTIDWWISKFKYLQPDTSRFCWFTVACTSFIWQCFFCESSFQYVRHYGTTGTCVTLVSIHESFTAIRII